MTQIDYNLDAKTKLAQCGGTISIRLSNTKTAPWEGSMHHPHYRFTLKGPGGSYTSDFWDSIAAGESGEAATAYDILACLQWNDPVDFENFCSDFDYEQDSRAAHKTFMAVAAQFKALKRIFPADSAREMLASIC